MTGNPVYRYVLLLQMCFQRSVRRKPNFSNLPTDRIFNPKKKELPLAEQLLYSFIAENIRTSSLPPSSSPAQVPYPRLR